MGCPNSRQKYKDKLKIESDDKIDDRMMENIMMNTYFDERELYLLYRRFQKLEPNENGLLRKSQLLEMAEFKFCAFKKYLSRAFKLETLEAPEKETKQAKNIHSHEDEPEPKKKDKSKKNNFIAQPDQDPQETTNFNKLNSNKLILKENTPKDTKLEERSPSSSDDLPSISFSNFCDIMKIFNEKYPVDLKIRFYFKLYDMDGDNRISKDDLREFLREVFYDREKAREDSQNNDDIVLPQQEGIQKQTDENDEIDYGKLIDLVFHEIIPGEKRKYIEYDEFSKILWCTNIDKSCVISLRED